MSFLETDRLKLRPISIEDAPFILALFNSPGWLQFIGDRNVKNVGDAEKYILEKYSSIHPKGYGNYGVQLKSEPTLIGTCGLYKRDNLEHPDIGFAMLPQFMGKGYGYEAATTMMEYARQTLGLSTILGFTLKENMASRRLLEKIGLRNIGTYNFEEDPEELLLFST